MRAAMLHGVLCCWVAALVVALGVAGCGGDGGPPHRPDAGPSADAGPDAPADARPDAPIDAMPDAAPDAPPADAPQLLSFVTPYGGSNDLRQSDRTSVVVTGAHLNGATSLTIDGVAAMVTGVTPTRISALFDTPAGHPPGLADVVVTTPRGRATLIDAAQITPFVVAPDPGQGRGTYDSPISFCDPQLLEARPGDTISLLPGGHCPSPTQLSFGLTFEGASGGTSVLGSGLFFIGDAVSTTTFRRVAFTGSLSVWFENPAGHLILQDVTDEGGMIVRARSATFERYTFTGRAGATAALQLLGGQVSIRDSRIEGSSLGIELVGGGGGGLTLRHTTVQGTDDAALRISAADAAVDLGTTASPGGNALSVTSGVALDDARATPAAGRGVIQAVGTTLNGNGYVGQRIQGPATSLPDYRISSGDAALQF